MLLPADYESSLGVDVMLTDLTETDVNTQGSMNAVSAASVALGLAELPVTQRSRSWCGRVPDRSEDIGEGGSRVCDSSSVSTDLVGDGG